MNHQQRKEQNMSKKMTNAELASENSRLAAEIADLKTQLAASANIQNPLPFLRSLLLRQKDYNHSRRDLQIVTQDGYDFLDADEDACKRAFDRWMKETVRTTLVVSGQTDEGKFFEGRKDAEVIDETPGAYKDIDHVMAAQADLVDIVHTLRQILCVKG